MTVMGEVTQSLDELSRSLYVAVSHFSRWWYSSSCESVKLLKTSSMYLLSVPALSVSIGVLN